MFFSSKIRVCLRYDNSSIKSRHKHPAAVCLVIYSGRNAKIFNDEGKGEVATYTTVCAYIGCTSAILSNTE